MKQKVEIKDEEIGKLVKGFSEINKIGIPFTNFYLITLCLIKNNNIMYNCTNLTKFWSNFFNFAINIL